MSTPPTTTHHSDTLQKLHPTWLSTHPETEQRSAFIRYILPLLAFRADHQTTHPPLPLSNWNIGSFPDLSSDEWAFRFSASAEFDVEDAVKVFEDCPVRYLGRLENMAVGLRAQAVNERLWINCAEFYLVAIAKCQLQYYENMRSERQDFEGPERRDQMCDFVDMNLSLLRQNQGIGIRTTLIGEIEPEKAYSGDETSEEEYVQGPEMVDTAALGESIQPEDTAGSEKEYVQGPELSDTRASGESFRPGNAAGFEDESRREPSLIPLTPMDVPLQHQPQTLVIWFRTSCVVLSEWVFFFLCAIPILWPLLVPYMIYCMLTKGNTSAMLSHDDIRFPDTALYDDSLSVGTSESDREKASHDLGVHETHTFHRYEPLVQWYFPPLTDISGLYQLSVLSFIKKVWLREPHQYHQGKSFPIGFREAEVAGVTYEGIWDPSWKEETIVNGVWEVYKQGPKHSTDKKHGPAGGTWHQFCQSVKFFCEIAGSPEISADPFENIVTLRRCIAGRTSHIGILYGKIEGLQRDISEQRRIITSLSYRHLLESLPAKSNKTNTKRWKELWRDAWEKSKSDVDNPLAKLREEYKNDSDLRLINNFASNLYGSLSSNIHRYSNGKVELSDQWNDYERDTLKALAPILGPNGDVRWEDERKRFGWGFNGGIESGSEDKTTVAKGKGVLEPLSGTHRSEGSEGSDSSETNWEGMERLFGSDSMSLDET